MSNNKAIVKKVSKITLATAATVAAGAVATNTAHADATTPANDQQPAASQQTQNQSVSSLKQAQDQSRANYAKANEAQKQAQGNYNQASDAIKAASDAQAQLTHDQALQDKAQANVNQATQLEQEVEATAKQQGIDVNSVTNAQHQAQTAQANADSAQAKANQAQTDLSNAQKASDQANADLQKAQGIQQAATKSVNNAQANLTTAQQNVDALNNQGQAIKDAANKVSQAKTAKTNADNDVNTKQSTFNSAKTKLDNDQAKLNNADTDVPGNGDNSSNGSLRLDDQFNNLYNNYQSKLTQTANAGNWNEHNKVADEMDTATHNLMNQWNKNVTNQYLDDNTKIPASHTLTSLNDSYQSDPALRRILTKIGYQAQYDWKPSDPNNLHSQWIKTAIYNEDNRGLSINASINATNYLLELINPLRQARGLKPLSTNMSAIQNASQAVTKIVKLPELSAGASANSQASMEQRYNQIQQLKDQYNFTNYDQDSNHIRELTGSQNGYGAMVDISSLPDHGWVSIDNLHRALFAYAKNQANGEDNSIMGDKDFLLSATQSAVAVQIGEDDNIYVFLSTPVTQSSANTTALQAAVNQDKQALAQAQSALTQAKNVQAQSAQALQQAQASYAQLTNGAKDPATLQANLTKAKQNLAQAKANLQAANQAVSQAQTKADQAKAKLTAAKTANDQAQSTLKTAQDALKKANAELDRVTKGNQTLLQAIKSVKDAQHNLDVAKAQVKADQAQIAKLSPEAKHAQAKIDDLKKVLDEANAKLAQAKANLITDAKVYGNVVEVNDAKMYAKEALPSLTLKNATADDPTQSELDGLMLEMATMPGDTIPTGTKVSFKDSAKALADSQVPGDYVEDVLVTFPDGSTVTKQIKLHVDKAVSGLPSGWKIVNGHVVDSEGHVIAGYSVDAHGNVVKIASNSVKSSENGSEKIDTMSVTPSRSALCNGQLPQTGNNDEAGLIALASVSLVAMFGLAVTKKRA